MSTQSNDGNRIDSARSEVRGGAFFDLDGTLIYGNSALLWLRYEWSHSRAVPWAGIGGLLRSWMGRETSEQRLRRWVRTAMTGTQVSTLRAAQWAFTDEVLLERIDPWCQQQVKAHQAQGRQAVLITAASPYVAEAMVNRLNLDDFIATELAQRGDIHTGQVMGLPCFGSRQPFKRREDSS